MCRDTDHAVYIKARTDERQDARGQLSPSAGFTQGAIGYYKWNLHTFAGSKYERLFKCCPQ